jgi:hypothetical protein
MTLMNSDELACRWTWLIMLMEKDDERTGSALAIARRGGRREVEPQRALAGRGGRPHRLAGAMVCVVSSQQSGCFGRAVSGGGGQTVPWNSIHGLRAVKPAAWVSAFKSRELPALSIRCGEEFGVLLNLVVESDARSTVAEMDRMPHVRVICGLHRCICKTQTLRLSNRSLTSTLFEI